ncbi:Methionyl-tRNA formyltransferase [Candidatus Mikella endobia]|uniref:Methionyl-tRNA formyltransferase n=1 Tax=Candidatus Mikella endobia TaxID=1778264 RepID=A0A143WPR1_9ENTR|nr:methionyl-tRNA formyltransferase [Candidatus Mikella endobia]CUX95673.1 Methionyl-tRNA formyltransferase [Candidatus Mikella endobia]
MFYSLRIIFAGTPYFAACHLNALMHTKHNLIGVLTQPDRPAGQRNRFTLSPVKQLAEKYNVPVFQPFSLQTFEVQRCLAELNADILIVVAYSMILPKAILDIPKLGCINVHGSLLPRWRGAAPIQRALLSGDQITGVTIIKMDAGIDTGPVLYRTICPIQPDDTSASLSTKLAIIGSNALLTTLELFISGNITAEPQNNELISYASKINKEEARIDWSLSAIQIERCIRAFNPWPISYFIISGHYIRVWAARVNKQLQTAGDFLPGTIFAVDKDGIHITTGDGILTLTKLQPDSKKVMSVQELLNSRSEWFIPGMVLV